ncbi:MAG: hypothetical protein J6M95_02610 [Bacilli bacterium]|nr:hypothetical protein [Bacilli bacterium]
MKNKFKLLILLALPSLASCGGFSLDYIVEGNKYNSPVFTENYYEHWDNELKNAQEVASIDVTDKKITSFADVGIIDQNILLKTDYTLRDYSSEYNLMRSDQSFYYGVQSKLFDGEAYCDGYYQKHRVQTNQNGFSVRFSKESDELTYFAMQFKATTNNQLKYYLPSDDEYDVRNDHALFHNSVIELTIGLYTKNESEIENHSFKSEITFDNNHTNDGSYYVFYAFDLKEYELSRLVGVSVTFDIISDELVDYNKTKGVDIDYALFVYEIFLPYTYWH